MTLMAHIFGECQATVPPQRQLSARRVPPSAIPTFHSREKSPVELVESKAVAVEPRTVMSAPQR